MKNILVIVILGTILVSSLTLQTLILKEVLASLVKKDLHLHPLKHHTHESLRCEGDLGISNECQGKDDGGGGCDPSVGGGCGPKCNQGFTWTTSGCEPTTITNTNPCPEGTTWNSEAGVCDSNAAGGLNGGPKCPPGYTLNIGTESCKIKPPVPPKCPTGKHLVTATGTCVKNSPHCPFKEHLDTKTNKCVLNELVEFNAGPALQKQVLSTASPVHSNDVPVTHKEHVKRSG